MNESPKSVYDTRARNKQTFAYDFDVDLSFQQGYDSLIIVT